MGFAKEQMHRQQQRMEHLQSIAVEVGEMEVCVLHEDMHLDPMGGQEETLTAARSHYPDLPLDELKAEVEEAFANSGMECPICAKNMAD